MEKFKNFGDDSDDNEMECLDGIKIECEALKGKWQKDPTGNSIY